MVMLYFEQQTYGSTVMSQELDIIINFLQQDDILNKDNHQHATSSTAWDSFQTIDLTQIEDSKNQIGVGTCLQYNAPDHQVIASKLQGNL